MSEPILTRTVPVGEEHDWCRGELRRVWSEVDRLKAENERACSLAKRGQEWEIECTRLCGEVATLKAENERLTKAAVEALEAAGIGAKTIVDPIYAVCCLVKADADPKVHRERVMKSINLLALKNKVADLEAAVAAKDAAIAGMREALEAIFEAKEYNDERWVGKLYDAGQKAKAVLAAALASDAGSALLRRLQAAEAVCEACNHLVFAPETAGERRISDAVAAWRKECGS